MTSARSCQAAFTCGVAICFVQVPRDTEQHGPENTNQEKLQMSEETEDQGIIQVVVDRLEKQRLPAALELLEKVNNGEKLNDMELAFLDNVFKDTQSNRAMLEKYPAWQPLAARMIGLYNEITTKALENEKASGEHS
jgi:hypothetical protein